MTTNSTYLPTTRLASSVTVLDAKAADSGAAGTQAAPVPPKIREMESDIKRESRRWRAGVRAGAGFDPELFMFGVQSEMGPIFHPRVFFAHYAQVSTRLMMAAYNSAHPYALTSEKNQQSVPFGLRLPRTRKPANTEMLKELAEKPPNPKGCRRLRATK